MKLIREGECVPLFYLPVRMLDFKREMECYFFLWAIPAYFLYLIYDIFMFTWRDMIRFMSRMRKYKNIRGGEDE